MLQRQWHLIRRRSDRAYSKSSLSTIAAFIVPGKVPVKAALTSAYGLASNSVSSYCQYRLASFQRLGGINAGYALHAAR